MSMKETDGFVEVRYTTTEEVCDELKLLIGAIDKS